MCTGIQGISAQLLWGWNPSDKVCLSAKCCVLAFKASAVSGGVHGQRRLICQVLVLLVGGGSIGRRFVCKFELTSKFSLASQRSFHITYERPIISNILK